MTVDTRARSFRVMVGGPLRRLEHRLRLGPDEPGGWRRRALFYVGITYAPLLLVAVIIRLATGAWPPAMLLVDSHLRHLVVIPLLLLAEELIDGRVSDVVPHFLDSEIVPASERHHLDEVVASTARLRDSAIIELCLVAVVVLSILEQVELPNVALPVGWAQTLSLGVLRLLLLRLLWRWTVWAVFLGRVARLRLALVPTHSDQSSGLGVLLAPSVMLSLAVAAAGAKLATSFADHLARTGAELDFVYVPSLALVLGAEALALAPLLVFVPPIYRARRRELVYYSSLTCRHAHAFGRRWLRRGGREALGAADISSLCDLGTSYAVLERGRSALWSPHLLVAIAAGALLPLTPLVLFEMRLDEALLRVISVVVK